MTTEKSGSGVDQEGSTASSSATTEATGLRAYGVTVRRVELRVPVPRTTFDVIVNCGLGRWNAEMVADRIRGFLREALDRGYALRCDCESNNPLYHFGECPLADPTALVPNTTPTLYRSSEFPETNPKSASVVLAVDPSWSTPERT